MLRGRLKSDLSCILRLRSCLLMLSVKLMLMLLPGVSENIRI